MDRILQQYAVSKENTEQPFTIDVSILRVAPIFVVYAVGYTSGIFVLLMELCAHGNILKYWPRGIGRIQ